MGKPFGDVAVVSAPTIPGPGSELSVGSGGAPEGVLAGAALRCVGGQLQGGYSHGLGYALFEEASSQADGGFPSASFLDYTIASAPELTVEPRLLAMVTPTPANPEGFKGAGESGTVPVPATIANAVEDAIRQLRPDAVVNELPIGPMRLFEVLS